ncbi:hypothetical protein [Mesorhizobium sp. M1136]|uniref:hypothetical protein n=1 Tax=Mesorhizobium sp. M1136 TaxID=2957059 RepID=UPI00333966F2
MRVLSRIDPPELTKATLLWIAAMAIAGEKPRSTDAREVLRPSVHETSPGRYDDYPASELSEPTVVFTEDGINNLRHIVDERRAAGHAPPKPTAETIARNHSHRGLGRTVTNKPCVICDLARGSMGCAMLLDAGPDIRRAKPKPA